MRQFNLKGEVLVEDPRNVEADLGGRSIPKNCGWSSLGRVLRNYEVRERPVRPEREVTEDMLRAAREWLDHVEAGRIG